VTAVIGLRRFFIGVRRASVPAYSGVVARFEAAILAAVGRHPAARKWGSEIADGTFTARTTNVLSAGLEAPALRQARTPNSRSKTLDRGGFLSVIEEAMKSRLVMFFLVLAVGLFAATEGDESYRIGRISRRTGLTHRRKRSAR
jgi:hypothetical protein